MKKTLDYLYIFSKLSTSFILLFIILIFGYIFYVSFKNQETSDNQKLELLNKLDQNEQKLSKLYEKIEFTENSIEEIKISIQGINNSDQSKEIVLLNNKIGELDQNLKNISGILKEIKIVNTSELNKSSSNNILNPVIDKNKKEITKLINYKFENSLDFSEELDILQNLNNNNNQHIFEKLNLIKSKNYRGNKYLKDIYFRELDLYLKEKFNNKLNNIITKSVMNFVAIQPSKTNTIKNNQTLVLKEISILIEERSYKMSYAKIVTIKDHQTYFSETLKQIQIALDFMKLINKVS